MNFHNIEYFLTIAEERNISKAAARLYISQQSLSEQLKKMEEEVGAPLVKRGRVITLTSAGEIFKRAGEELLNTYSKMLDDIATITEKEKTTITVAIPTTETPQFLPGLLAEFSADYPEFEVKIIQCQPKEAAKVSGTFDLYFSTLPLGPELEHIPIIEGGTYTVAFKPELAKRIYGERWPEVEEQLQSRRDISVLRDMPFILLLNQLGEVVLDQQIIFKEAGFTPTVAFQSGTGELNANMCILGAGVYLSTMDHANHRFRHKDGGRGEPVQIYPIDTSIAPVLVALSHRKGMHLTEADRCFIEAAREYLKKTVS